MNETFTFAGVNSAAYGVYISGESVYNAPSRDVDMVTVPGRNGTIALDGGRFENIEVTYPAFCWASDQQTYAANIRAFRNALKSKYGYHRLIDDYNPNEYRLAVYRDEFNVSPSNYSSAGEFEIVFDCKPQRWLTSGETPVVVPNNGTITNPTEFPSEPVLTVTGDGTLYVGNYSLVIEPGATNPIIIDCELMEAYEINSADEVINRNNLVTYQNGTFPRIEPGTVMVTYSGNITAVEIVPRWWSI